MGSGTLGCQMFLKSEFAFNFKSNLIFFLFKMPRACNTCPCFDGDICIIWHLSQADEDGLYLGKDN